MVTILKKIDHLFLKPTGRCGEYYWSIPNCWSFIIINWIRSREISKIISACLPKVERYYNYEYTKIICRKFTILNKAFYHFEKDPW